MDQEHQAIEWLKLGSEMSFAYYEKPLLLCYSGGKDSDVVLELAKRSGIPFEIQHSHTTVDAPQTVHHVRKKFYELELQGFHPIMNYPNYQGQRTSMWELIPQKRMPPTRIVRYCCEILKEQAGDDRMICTGVRKQESNNRSKRGWIETISRKKKDKVVLKEESGQLSFSDEIFLTNDNDSKRKIIEHCMKKKKSACNPIADFSNHDIWDFISSEHIEINLLYELGFDRVGCIGCPVAGDNRWREFQLFPSYRTAYIHAFDRMIEARTLKTNWDSGEKVFLWWMEDKNLDNQISFDEGDEYERKVCGAFRAET